MTLKVLKSFVLGHKFIFRRPYSRVMLVVQKGDVGSPSNPSPDSKSNRERVVILGSGWAGFRLAKDLDKSKFEVVVVSPRNHFLFTPLLPSTTTGTLEFRCAQEPVRTIKGVKYHQSRAESIDFEQKFVRCLDFYPQHQRELIRFNLPFDKLVIAVGTKSTTFGVPGLASYEETGDPRVVSVTGTDRHNVMFLKQLTHARSIRNRIIECFERASNPHVTDVERSRLLTFVVVGGGPTSVEFASELHDFLKNDVTMWFKDLKAEVRVIIVEAGKNLLGSFDSSLQSYVKKKFQKRNIEVLTEVFVTEVKAESVMVKRIGIEREDEIPFGICVWATGNETLHFVKNLGLETFKGGPAKGRIKIDECLNVADRSVSCREDVYALGDCAGNQNDPLGLLAQVANQQGKYLAKSLNKGRRDPFCYTFMGSMAQLGTFDAVVEGPFKKSSFSGLMAFLAWRSAYWTYSVSITNKMLIPMYWFKSFWFGRDISKF